jgi:hypothetical protein
VTGKRKKRRPVGETIGGIIVGFDQQIFRTTPPVQELIAKAKPVRTVSGQDGGEFEVVFPDDGETDGDEPTTAQPDPEGSNSTS